MLRLLRAVWRGAGYLPGYGHHPGWPVLVAVVMLGLLAGSWRGALIMLAVSAPAFLLGCYSRGASHAARPDHGRPSP